MRRTVLAAVCAASSPAFANQATPPKTFEAFKADVLAQPGMAKAVRDIYAGSVVTAMRLRRLTMIGLLCKSLSQVDADTINANARKMLEEDSQMLPDADKGWAAAYLEGARAGALQSASLTDATGEADCRRFAEPGGPLTRIMTWTDKPQEAAPGILASPRTMP